MQFYSISITHFLKMKILYFSVDIYTEIESLNLDIKINTRAIKYNGRGRSRNGTTIISKAQT